MNDNPVADPNPNPEKPILSTRHYLFEEDGTLRRVSLRVLEGLVAGKLAMPEYAGQTVRFITVRIRMVNRRAHKVWSVRTEFFRADEAGRIDDGLRESGMERWERYGRARKAALALAVGSPHEGVAPKVDIGEGDWDTTDAERDAILDAIFPEDRPRDFRTPRFIEGTRAPRAR